MAVHFAATTLRGGLLFLVVLIKFFIVSNCYPFPRFLRRIRSPNNTALQDGSLAELINGKSDMATHLIKESSQLIHPEAVKELELTPVNYPVVLEAAQGASLLVSWAAAGRCLWLNGMLMVIVIIFRVGGASKWVIMPPVNYRSLEY